MLTRPGDSHGLRAGDGDLAIIITYQTSATQAAGAPAADSRSGLPKEFAGYRAWGPMLKAPKLLPLEVWVRCIPMSDAEWKTAAKKYGPHIPRAIQVYGNPSAVPALRGSGQGFPTGSVIIKEKEALESKGLPLAVAVMVKRDTEAFKESGGWEFLYFPTPKPAAATESCVSCHRLANPRTFVAGDYPAGK